MSGWLIFGQNNAGTLHANEFLLWVNNMLKEQYYSKKTDGVHTCTFVEGSNMLNFVSQGKWLKKLTLINFGNQIIDDSLIWFDFKKMIRIAHCNMMQQYYLNI